MKIIERTRKHIYFFKGSLTSSWQISFHRNYYIKWNLHIGYIHFSSAIDICVNSIEKCFLASKET
jgi:hypothetical protein